MLEYYIYFSQNFDFQSDLLSTSLCIYVTSDETAESETLNCHKYNNLSEKRATLRNSKYATTNQMHINEVT